MSVQVEEEHRGDSGAQATAVFRRPGSRMSAPSAPPTSAAGREDTHRSSA